jgi:hypothetical protein
MGLPAEIAHHARPGGRAHPAAHRRVGQRRQGAIETAGICWIVEQTLAVVLDQPGQARDGRRHHGQARRHVFEHLQRRPVEPQLQRPVTRRIERRDANIGVPEGGRHAGVRNTARKLTAGTQPSRARGASSGPRQ